MLAYLLPGVEPESAPGFLRGSRLNALAPLGKWHCLSDLKGGTIAHLPGWDKASTGTRTETPEGWTYLGPSKIPKPEELRRVDHLESAEVHLDNGQTVHVPIAKNSPRRIVFKPGGGSFGRSTKSWAIDAFRLWERQEDRKGQDGVTYRAIMGTMEEMIDIVFRALAECYAITPELATEVFEITARDLIALLYGIWGYPLPKAGAGSSESRSPSLPAESPTEPPSPATSSTASATG